jgi:hypothetical protein
VAVARPSLGLLSRSTHGPEIWTSILSGVPRLDEDDFRWHGEAKDEAQAFLSVEASWLRWCYWAESVARSRSLTGQFVDMSALKGKAEIFARSEHYRSPRPSGEASTPEPG